jgi:signal transduction histidine kinase/DNA-binding response OmpR family regulator
VGFWYVPISSIHNKSFEESWVSDDLALFSELTDNASITREWVAFFKKEKLADLHALCLDAISNKCHELDRFTHSIELKSETTIHFSCSIKCCLNQDEEVVGFCIFYHQQEVGDNYDKTYQNLNKLLNEATSLARVGGWEVDLANGKQPIWSQVTREIHEVPEDYIPNFTEAVNFYKEGYDRDLVQKVVGDAIQNGGSWDIECRLITYKKREVWVRSIGRAEMENGKCVRLFGVFQDIDRIKRIEDEKNQILQRLDIATSNAGIGIWELDILSERLDWNDKMYELYQIDKANFDHSYNTWANSLTASDRLRAENLFKDALDGKGVFDLTFSIKWPDNSVRYLRALAHVFRDDDGKAIKILGTNWDVTEEERLKSDLRYNKSILEESSATALLGGWEYEVSTQEFHWSDMMKVIHDVPSDYMPTVAGILDFIENEDSQLEIKQALKEAYKYGNSWDIELKIKTEKGSSKWVRSTGRAVFEEGKLVRIFGTYQDISRIKSIQLSLVEAKNEAIEANKSKSMFVANMSHEIRTPLNGVIGFIELLSQTSLSSSQLDILKNANISARNLLLIINDILDLSKIEAGKLELDPVKFNLHVMLYSVINTFNYLAEKKGIDLILDLGRDLPTTILADELRLTQILNNLLGNAIKFTEKGFIRVAIDFEPNSESDGKVGEFTFSVEDTGIGITNSQQQKLFKAFSQADSSTSRKYGGTGLGLAISNMILSQMGSKISLKSKIGVGSTFSFKINLPFNYLSDKTGSKTVDHIQRVLVVDDIAYNCMIAKTIMSDWGIEVSTASSAFEAITKIAKEDDFDLLLTDYRMPKVNGIELVREIRENLKISEEKLPVILMHSSPDDADIIKESKPLGISYKLTKPLNPEELFSRLSRIHGETSVEENDIKPENLKNKVLHESLEPVILIAEDVDLNRILIKALIKRYLPNAIIHEAEDGLAAVSKYKKLHPDLILMDIQMPKQDGYKSTELIRKFEETSLDVKTNIVALTALAINIDKANINALGLDDYITKPIIPLELRRVLKEQLGITEDEEPFAVPKTEPIEIRNGLNASIFDATEMKERFLDNQELVAEMFNQVWERLDSTFEQIILHENKLEWHTVRDLAHKLKGLSQNFSFTALSKKAASVESAELSAVEGNLVELKEAYEELISYKEQIEEMAR